ncbi:MAG: YD repeat-containing protein, partial [bacterium]
AARLEKVTDKRGNVIKTIAYANNRVISQTFADGGVERYEYSFAGSVVTSVKITDPENRVTLKRFNGTGYVIFELDGLGQPSIITRDINTNLPTQVNGPCGCAEDIKTYDAKGNVLTMTDRLGQIMRYEYDPIYSFVTKVTDKNGHIIRFTYDSRGNRTSVINAKGETTTFTYDQFGQQTSMTDALNHTWSMVYDAQGNVTSKSDPLNNTSTMTYDGIGRMLSMNDPLGRINSVIYDAMSRVIASTDPANATTTYTYDQNGNQTAMTNALNNTWTMQYDPKNNLINQKHPLTSSDNGVQRQIQLQYNLHSELVTLISPSSRISSFTYDSRGQRRTATDPLGAVVNYNYDINYNLLFLSDQRNNVTTYDYDDLYRIIKITDPQGKITRASYDSEGNVIAIVDRLGRNTTINYDELDRPLKVTYIDAVVTYQYDPAGRKTRVDDTQFGGSFIAWTYDNANRLLSETTNQGVVSYIYNAASQTVLMKAANCPTVNYTYDNAGRLSTIGQNLGQGLESFTYNYDILSRRNSLSFPNGVITTYSYDENNRLVKLKHQKETNPAIEHFQYSYNAESEMIGINSLFSTLLLPSTQNNAIADSTNRISTFGTNNHSFNSVGEVTSKISASQTTLYNWDHRGRLTAVSLPDGQEVNYTYDAINRKISHSYQGNNTKFLYDGQEIVLDITSNNTEVDYLHGGQLDEVLRQNKTTETFYFHKNNLRSTIALSDINGSVIERTQYGVFGDSTNTSITRYGYAGREKDSVTNLIYYRARWYDPAEGRFLREDPIEFRGGLNLYAYANNNPILYIDPQGLSCQNSTCDFYCDEGVRKQMQKAWSRAQLGDARPEFSFCVFRFPNCTFGVSEIMMIKRTKYLFHLIAQ